MNKVRIMQHRENKPGDVEISEWRTQFNKFCAKSSIHGLTRLADNHDEGERSIYGRLAWSLIIVFLSIILVLAIGTISIEAFGRSKVYTSMTMATNQTMMFPDIHICDSSFFSRKRLLEMGFNDTMGTYLIAAQSTLLVADGLRRDKERNKEFSEVLDQLLEPYGGDFHYVSTQAALKCDEMIVGCVKYNQRLNGSECCAKYFAPTKFLNGFGSCTSTAGQEPYQEIMAVNLRGMTVLVRMNPDQLELDPKIIAPSLLEKRGIVFSVSDQSVYNYGSLLSHAHYVTPGTAAMIGLTLTKTDNSAMKDALLAPYTCYFHDEPNNKAEGYSLYSKSNCQLSAIQQMYNEYFGCNTISLPPINAGIIDIRSSRRFLQFNSESRNNRTYCLPKDYAAVGGLPKFNALIVELQQECIKDCILMDYGVQMSLAKLTLSQQSFDEYGIDRGETSEEEMASLHFYYPSLSYVLITNQPESLLKWLGEVGGNMGLYVGASLVSVLEILTFLFQNLFR